VYVQPYPANGDKWTISTSGGTQPQWRSDGKELYFLSPALQIEGVDIVQMGGRFDYGVPHPLFTTRIAPLYGPLAPYRAYAAAADGQSFIINEVLPEKGPDPLIVIVNWTGLLHR